MIRRFFLLCLTALLPSVAVAQSGLGPISPRTSSSSGGGVTPATLTDATYCPDLGASDAYVCSMVSAPSAYAAGMLVTLSANTANTGTASVNVNALGVKTITRADGSTLVTGDITATSPLLLEYDGTNFRMLSQWMRGSTGSGSYVLATSPTITNGTDSGGTGFSITTGYLNFSADFTGVNMENASASGAGLYRATSASTPDSVNLSTGSTSNSIHFNERSDFAYDFQNPCLTGLGTVACTDPTFILHSSVQATNQAMSLGHNQTQGVITANGGILARSLTYASGSDVGLTVQGSLTGNIQEWKTAANTAVGAVTVAGAGLFADGSAAAPGMGFYGTPTTGIYRSSSGIVASILTNSYTTISSATYGGPVLGSSSWLVWSNNTSSVAGTPDLFLIRKASGVLNVGSSITNTTGLIGGGAAVASATAMPLPTGRVFHVTGTTNITSITSTNFASGAVITIIFDGVLTFTDGSNLKLAGDFVTTAGSTITLVYDGTNWYEIARSVN